VKPLRMIRILILAAWVAGAIVPAVAQTAVFPYWLTLEQGKRYFREGEYGKALLTFEDAKRQRKAKFEDLENSLIYLLSIDDVRKLDDSLPAIEEYIAENKKTEAQRALDELYLRVPRNALKNSGLEALRVLGTLKAYPEADYWIGESYRLEGEYGIALKQYSSAYDQRALLDTPEFAVEILYRMADIHYQQQEYQKMEAILSELLSRDRLWSDESESFLRKSMDRTLAQQGLDRFLLLYRYEYALSERAHRRLGFYYYATGRHPKAREHLVFAFLVQVTTLINELKRLDFDFAFTGYRALLDAAGERALLREYLRTTDAYRTAYYLGAALFATGERSTAVELWKSLSSQTMAGEWRDRARRQLTNPVIEPIVENP